MNAPEKPPITAAERKQLLDDYYAMPFVVRVVGTSSWAGQSHYCCDSNSPYRNRVNRYRGIESHSAGAGYRTVNKTIDEI